MNIPADDRGFTLGDGLFETILWADGELVGFAAHAARLARGCETIGLTAPEIGELEAAAAAAIAAEGLSGSRAAVRLTWTAGSGGRGLARPAEVRPRLIATAASAPRPKGPVRLATASVRRNETSPASRLKTLSYLDNILARREAEAAGADEALMLNTKGEVACAGVANLFWLKDGRLFTPALDAGVLDGVVRGEIIEAARRQGVAVEETRSGPEVLFEADGVFLTNSLIGVRPAESLDGRGLGQQLGQVTELLRRGRR